jgi:hypothetical protein
MTQIQIPEELWNWYAEQARIAGVAGEDLIKDTLLAAKNVLLLSARIVYAAKIIGGTKA